MHMVVVMSETISIHQPHDKLFRVALRDIYVARDFLQAYLPQGLLTCIDLSQLKIHKETFVDGLYQGIVADVVYAIPFINQTNWLYVLFEHQSQIDRSMAWRLMNYMMGIMRLHSNQHPLQPHLWDVRVIVIIITNNNLNICFILIQNILILKHIH